MKKWFWPILFPVLLFMGAANLFPEKSGRGPLEEILGSPLFEKCRMASLDGEISAYCPGSCCNTGLAGVNGKRIAMDWGDQVASGDFSLRRLRGAGVSVAAVDREKLPFGSILLYNGRLYMALDAGGAIRGERIDISLDRHEDTVQFGRRYHQPVTAFIPRDPESVVRRVREMLDKTAARR